MMDTCPKNLEKFVDFDKCVQLIDDLNTKLSLSETNEEKCQPEAEKLTETFRKIIDHYLEQPELLEPYLPELIQKLTSSLNGLHHKSVKYHVIFKYLYQLIKVNGFKYIGKKFPHEADKLPYLVSLLDHEDPAYIKILMNWQTRYVLTVWLSIVILTPFDLAKFDDGSREEPIADSLYTVLKRSLKYHDSCQHATSYCLAKFFSRPDVIKSDLHLNEFISTTLDMIKNIKSGSSHVVDDPELIGYMRTLSYMFKFLPRAEMKSRCNAILDVLTECNIDAINREFVNYLIIKLLQRAGLSLLPKRVATWRYKRGARILGIGQVPTHSSQTSADNNKPASEQVAEQIAIESANNLEEEESEAADYIESILNSLFVAAQNAQTRVRWSAAKGIARLASRLSRERASDVIDMVLDNFFNETSSEFAWHGGCLTLAEMSRNGLILEEKLDRVTEIISKAIIYDKIKGSFAVGAHVREGACYVFWAMARTYEDHLLGKYIPSISVNLLCTMLFDRELQCRRAASATFQELVGRQGTFNIEGIDILTKVDYQNVGQRPVCYLSLATQVGASETSGKNNKYSEPFVRHLLSLKLGHWDIQIRRLASESIGLFLSQLEMSFIKSHLLPELVKMSEQNLDNNAKHGAILALARCISSLKGLDAGFDFESVGLIQFVGSLVEKCDKQLKSKQQAVNFLEAIGQIILSAEQAKFAYKDDSETLKQWSSIALSTLDNDNADLREIGATAVLTLYRSYYARNKTSQDRLLTTLNKTLRSLNESSRCGALRALAKLGQALGGGTGIESVGLNKEAGESLIRTDADTPDIILTSLTTYIGKPTREVEHDIVFAHAKAEACDSFVKFCKALDKSQLILASNYISAGYEALIGKTEDYTIDKRGDIGVVVRKAAVKALQDLTLHLEAIDMLSEQTALTLGLTPQRIRLIMARIIQQAVSYHNSARETAALAFYKLIEASSRNESESQNALSLGIAHRKEIIELMMDKFKVDDTFNWRDESTPIFVQLLDKPEYGVDLWIGLLPNVGQISDLCAKQSRDSLSNYLQSLSSDSMNDNSSNDEDNNNEQRQQQGEQQQEEQTNCKLDAVLSFYLEAMERDDMHERLLAPGLVVADYLLIQGLLGESSLSFQLKLARFCWKWRRSSGQDGASKLASMATDSQASRRVCAATGSGGNSTTVATETSNKTATTQAQAVASDPKRLISIASVLSSMLQFNSSQIQRECLSYLLALLCNGYSKVRSHTAEQLYLSIMTYQSELEEHLASGEAAEKVSALAEAKGAEASSGAPSAGCAPSDASGQQQQQQQQHQLSGQRVNLSAAMDLLSQTNWRDPLEKVRPVRAQISAYLQVNPAT